MLDIALVQQCSPQLPMVIAQAIVKTESSFNPFAIGVNRGGSRLAKQPSNFSEAVQTAKQLLARGANIDLGLAQINSANLKWLGLTVEQVFDPCNNLKAMQTVYLHCYSRGGNTGLGTRMQRAFSCYNTGNMRLGFSNGYVNKATRNFNEIVRLLNLDYAKPQSQLYSQALTQPYAVQNGSIVSLEPQQSDLPTYLPTQAQNANMSVSVRPSVGSSSHAPIPENISNDNMHVRVYNSWDIFRDFN